MICTKNKEKSTQKETLLLDESCVKERKNAEHMFIKDHHSDHEDFLHSNLTS